MSEALIPIEFGDLTATQRGQLYGDDPDPYEMAADTMQWQPKHRHVGLIHDGRLAASAGMVVSRIRVGDGTRHDVIGLGGVIVAAPYRGRGLARRVVGDALALGATLGPELAMLFCLPSRAGLYERLGFSAVDPPVRVAQPGGPQPVSLVVMWRTLRDGAGLPPAPVDVLTLPF